MDWGIDKVAMERNRETRDERNPEGEREQQRDVFAVLHYTYKRKEMRSGSEGEVAFCCSTVPTPPHASIQHV